MRESSQVKEMRESSQVKEMRGSPQVKEMWESSQVKEMRGSSQVKEMRGSSQVKEMWESSQVNQMRESSQVNQMWESSQVKEMWGEAMVSCFGLQNITCSGYNVIRVRKSHQKNITVVLNDSSTLVVIPDPDTTFQDYSKRYPVKMKGKTAVMYKAVHKAEDGTYYADYDHAYKYKIGKIHKADCDSSLNKSCTFGLHVSHFSWALNFGRSWSNMAILECSVSADKILVAKDCDGKVRTPSLKVIREVPPSEFESLCTA
jgi:hypothetical protein